MLTTMQGPAGTLRLDDGGEGGLPVIFAHSLGGHLGQWARALAHLQRSRRALAWDLRGHGGSELPADGDHSVEAQAGDLLAILDGRGIERAVFVGHSLGAMVAIAAAGRAPARCAGLFLEDPGSDPSLYPQAQVDHFLTELETNYEAMVGPYWEQLLVGASHETRREVLEALWATPREAIVRSFRDLGSFRAIEALRAFGGPVFVLAGPLGSSPDALQRVLGIRHQLLEGVSHYLHLDAPHAFADSLDRFLAERQG